MTYDEFEKMYLKNADKSSGIREKESVTPVTSIMVGEEKGKGMTFDEFMKMSQTDEYKKMMASQPSVFGTPKPKEGVYEKIQESVPTSLAKDLSVGTAQHLLGMGSSAARMAASVSEGKADTSAMRLLASTLTAASKGGSWINDQISKLFTGKESVFKSNNFEPLRDRAFERASEIEKERDIKKQKEIDSGIRKENKLAGWLKKTADTLDFIEEKGTEAYYKESKTIDTFGGRFATAIGNFFPSIVAGILSGGSSWAVPALTAVDTMMNAEESYKENIKNGMDEDEALKRSYEQSVLDSSISYLINKFGMLGKYVDGTPTGKINTWKDKAFELLKDSSFETVQEVWQEGLQNIATDRPFTENMGETAIITFLASLPFAGFAQISTVNPSSQDIDLINNEIRRINKKLNNNEKLTDEEAMAFILTQGKEVGNIPPALRDNSGNEKFQELEQERTSKEIDSFMEHAIEQELSAEEINQYFTEQWGIEIDEEGINKYIGKEEEPLFKKKESEPIKSPLQPTLNVSNAIYNIDSLGLDGTDKAAVLKVLSSLNKSNVTFEELNKKLQDQLDSYEEISRKIEDMDKRYKESLEKVDVKRKTYGEEVTPGDIVVMPDGSEVLIYSKNNKLYRIDVSRLGSDIRSSVRSARAGSFDDFGFGSEFTQRKTTLEEFIKEFREKKRYQGGHEPTEDAPKANNLTEKGYDIEMSSDFVQNLEEYFYTDDSEYGNATRESIEAIRKIDGRDDDHLVTVYRAAPDSEFNNGDWITFSKSYAQMHANREGGKVHSKKVPVGDVRFAGDDINEFVYYPSDESIKEYYESRKDSKVFKTKQKERLIKFDKAVDIINEFKKRHGVEFPVQVFEKIYTGSIVDGTPEQAFGMFFDNTISFSQMVSRFAAHHEFGHLLFRNLENLPHLKNIDRAKLYSELRKDMGEKGKTATLIDLEEHLMSLVEVRASEIESGTYKEPKRKTLLDRVVGNIIDFLTDLFGLSNDQMGEVQKFLDSMYFGKSDGSVVTLQSTNKTSGFMKTQMDQFGGDPDPLFKKIPNESDIHQEYYDYVNREVDLKRIEEDSKMQSYEEYLKEEPTKEEMKELEELMSQNMTLENERMVLDITEEVFESSPFRQLVQYVVKKRGHEFEGKLPEVGYLKKQREQRRTTFKGKEREVMDNRFAKYGDTIVMELFGFLEEGGSRNKFANDPDLVKEEFNDWYSRYKEFKIHKKRVLQSIRDRKSIDKFIEQSTKRTDRVIRMAEREQQRNDRLFTRGERAGVKIGRKIEKGISENKISEIKRKNELKKLEENIKSRMYTRTILDALKNNVPRSEWSRYMKRLTDVGVSEAKYTRLLEAIHEKGEEVALEKKDSNERAEKRKKIGFLRHMYNAQPSMIMDIRHTLDIRDTYKTGERAGQPKDKLKTIREMTSEELDMFIAELKKRIKFRAENPVRYIEDSTPMKERGVVGRVLKKVKDEGINVIERNIRNITKDEGLVKRIMSVFLNQEITLRDYHKKVTPFVSAFQKMSQVDRVTAKKALVNSNLDLARSVFEKNGHDFDKVYGEMRKVLDDVHEKLKAVGLDIGYVEDYFPRIWKRMEFESIERMIKIHEYRNGREMTQEERERVSSSLMQFSDSISNPFIDLYGKKFEKNRLLETIPDEYLDYLVDPIEALDHYLKSAIKTYEIRSLLGKNADGTLDDAKSIGYYVNNLVVDGTIKPGNAQELRDQLTSLFKPGVREGQKVVYDAVASPVYTILLSQITSAFRQINDVAKTVVLYGLPDTIRGVFSKNIDSKDIMQTINIADIEKGKSFLLGKTNVSQFLTIGLEFVDGFMQDVQLTTSYKHLVKMAKKNDSALWHKLFTIYNSDAKTNEVMRDLASRTGKETGETLSREIKLALLLELARIKPITPMQKTPFGVKNPLFYMLKSFTFQQFEFVRKEGLDYIYEGLKERDFKKTAQGAGKLTKVMAILLAFNVPIEMIIDWIRGKKNEKLKDYVFDGIFDNFFISAYSLSRGSPKGVINSIVDEFTPVPISFFSDTGPAVISDFKDIGKGEDVSDSRTLRYVPFVGNIYYTRFGRGATDYRTNREIVQDLYKESNGNMSKALRLRKELYKSQNNKEMSSTQETNFKKDFQAQRLFANNKKAMKAVNDLRGHSTNEDKAEFLKNLKKKDRSTYNFVIKNGRKKIATTVTKSGKQNYSPILISDNLFKMLK